MDNYLLNEFFDYSFPEALSPRNKKNYVKKVMNNNKNYCSQCKMYYHIFSNHCCFCRKNYNSNNIHCCLCNRTITNNLNHCDNCHIIYELTQHHCCKCNFTSGGTQDLRHCDNCHTVVKYYDLSKHVCKIQN